MKLNFWKHYFLLLSNIITINACLFQIVHLNKVQKTSHHGGELTGEKEHFRDLYTVVHPTDPYRKCVCGKERSNTYKMWYVIVQVTLRKSKKIRKCTGTVIAHNLVVTSHKCLVLEGKQIRPYEAWQPAPKHIVSNMAGPEDVVILGHEVVKVPVKNITYSLSYSITADLDVASASDIALIVVDDDLFEIVNLYREGEIVQENFRLPVCIPVKEGNSDWTASVTHRYGYYYGLGGMFPDDETPEIRRLNQLVVMDGQECDDEMKISNFSTHGSLCTRTVLPIPEMEGGPLLTTNVKGYFLKPFVSAQGQISPLYPQTTFLLGVSTVAKKHPAGKRIGYTYFSNVLENIDFIERVAEEHGSLWCETPRFVKTRKITKPDQLMVESWPWESEQVKARSETLNCACGMKNSKSGGRIAGGDDAIPYEFGWMVLYFFSFDTESFLQCGSSIINDRLIITAAHCVVANEEPHENVKKHILIVGTHMTEFSSDNNAKYATIKEFIVHPGYVPNLRDGHYNYDIALIILEQPLQFATGTKQGQVGENDIRPICLPKIGEKIDLKNGTMLTAMGWGVLNPWDPEELKLFPDVLQKLQVKVGDLNYCANKSHEVVPDTVICRANYKKKHGTTTGDSGGPITFVKPNGQYFQVGVVSYGYHFAPSEPGGEKDEWMDFWVDVQKFLPFIQYYSDLHGARWCKM